MNRMRKGGPWKLFRGNTTTFLNVMFGMVPDLVDQMLAGMLVYYHGRHIRLCGQTEHIVHDFRIHFYMKILWK